MKLYVETVGKAESGHAEGIEPTGNLTTDEADAPQSFREARGKVRT
jgi:hypothetical protein